MTEIPSLSQSMVKERPILMSGPMVRASWDELKTNTRRVIKGAEQFPIVSFEPWIVDGEQQYRESGIPLWFSTEEDGTTREWGCPYGQVGDRLWVRETFYCNSFDYPEPTDHARENLLYRADSEPDMEGETVEREGGGWKPSIHMPRWASRLPLEIIDVRVERLQSITEEDAAAEGSHAWLMGLSGRPYDLASRAACRWTKCLNPASTVCSHRGEFAALWESINAKRGFGWDRNPWVWAITFRKVETQ